jgi:hypothetical protein
MHVLFSVLAWIGHRGTQMLAVSTLVGIAVPPLAALLKPALGGTVFVLLTLTFLRIDPGAIRGQLRRPALLLAAATWLVGIIPAAFGLGLRALDLDAHLPGLTFALMLQAISAPLMAAPAFALLVGLQGSLALAVVVVSTLATPFTAAFFAHVFLGADLDIAPVTLALELTAFLAGSALVAAATRRLAGAAWVVRQTPCIDGLNVIALFVFAVAAMDGMAAHLATQPLLVAGLTAVTFAIALGSMAVTALVFARAGRNDALELGLTSGFRNIGLMVAALGSAVPAFTWLYFSVAQFPIYLLPHLLKLLVGRLTRAPAQALPASAGRVTRTPTSGNP